MAMLAESHHLNENAKWFLASIQMQIKAVLVFVGHRVHEELENKHCSATAKKVLVGVMSGTNGRRSVQIWGQE